MMRAIHVVNELEASHGGPSRSVPSLAAVLRTEGVDARIITHATGSGSIAGIAVQLVRREPARQLLGRSSHLSQVLLGIAGENTVMHDHGLWLPSNHATASVAKRFGLPRVVSTRGMLSPWSMQQSRVRKFIAWRLFQHRDLNTAQCLHATSEVELADVRRVKLRNPVALIPNGVVVPEPRDTEHPNPNRSQILFLSRLHEGKGVHDLIEAWRTFDDSEWKLMIAGPPEDEDISARVRELESSDPRVIYIGAVDDEAKWELYRSASLFVLPTRSENFGIVVAEALAAGLPVITTKGAPWQELETHRCGWWIDHGVEPLVEAMRHAMSLSDEERRAMGARGRELVEKHYSWDRVAREMISVYDWTLGRSAPPGCVYLD